MKKSFAFVPAALLAAAGSAFAIDITRPGDLIIPSSPNHPAGEPATAVADNTARTKYLNFDELNTGFTITPSGSGIVRHFTIITANDAADRDPFSYILEGSDDGVNFTPVSSGALNPPTTRYSIYSVPVKNNTQYATYRVTFPTVRNAAGANSMQVAEVQLATQVDITSPADQVGIILPVGAFTPNSENIDKLFDNRLDTKLIVRNAFNGQTVIDVTPAMGATIISGLAFFSGNDDVAFPGRTPMNVSISGSNNGVDYTPIYSTPIAQATDNYQDQEFQFTNTTPYTSYRLVFDIPHSAVDLQISDIQLYGVPSAAAPANDTCTAASTILPGVQYIGTTVNATGVDNTPCGSGDSADVWYRYTATVTGDVEITTRRSAIDTTLAVFTSCNSAPIACDDDGYFAQSLVRFHATSGATYFVRVAGANSTSGSFRLLVNEAPDSLHTDTPVALTYNFNGMVHAGEAGVPDAPNGYRSIASRGIRADDGPTSFGGGRVVGTTGIVYEIVTEANALDIVHLGARNNYDTVVDEDEIGILPKWLTGTDQSGPQTSNVESQGITLTADTRIGLLYYYSNGGGSFNWTLTFDDLSSAIITVSAPDWFSNLHPPEPSFGVEVQAQVGVFSATESTDRATPGTGLNVVEAIVSVDRLNTDGFGDFTGRRLVSMTVSDRTSNGAVAVFASSVRDADVKVGCAADFNNDDAVNSQDFFDFLNAFFAASPSADFNQDKLVNSQDFFDFLNSFFSGC